ncbi:unnamed protein product [Ectocarpus sp. CCAP 1310/34]|nr:unnamed protein product [Ectocarpus sp. CCAP 1310/34]
MPVGHRPGSLRQANKKHKGNAGHQSKRASKSALGAGRVANERGDPKAGVKRAAEARKQNRANHTVQMRKKKREEIWLQKRLGSEAGPPKLCVWVSLSTIATPDTIQQGVLDQCARTSGDPSTGVGMVSAVFHQFKQRVTFLTPGRDLAAVLEFAKVADLLLVVLPVQQGADSAVDEEGEMMITALKAAGLPAVVGVVQGLDVLKGKRQSDMKKWGQRFFETEFAGKAKAIDASNSSLLARTLSTTAPRRIHWRAIRSYLLADSTEVVAESGSRGDKFGTLHVRGYIRGRPLDVNQVVHVGDAGHFGLRQINSAAEPFPVKPKDRGGGALKGESVAPSAGVEVLARADPGRNDLSVEATVDNLAGEQTWPTEQELAQAGGEEEMDGMVDQKVKGNDEGKSDGKVLPQGWSGYQAEWLEGAGSVDGENEESSDEGEAWAFNDKDDDGDSVDPMDASLDAARRQVSENEDTRFPDEVDTPADRSARERFARFRALKSFRTSPWDPKESLPKDYARIFQFEDFPAMQKDVLRAGEAMERQQNQNLLEVKEGSEFGSRRSSFPSSMIGTCGAGMDVDSGAGQDLTDPSGVLAADQDRESYVQAGQYVEVVIDSVPLDVLEKRKKLLGARDWPLVMFSLLRHEHRLSALHFNINRDARFVEPIPSKEPLVFQCGFRRWEARPVFSQINLNCDKHKYERFLRQDRFSAASVYGPTTFQPSPVLVFKEVAATGSNAKRTVLVATGTLLGVDPDRIVLKKIVLTGYPIRVRKRKAVVKHMFHRPGDVKWFKPAELVTKYGLTGHIKEPVGTHGLMKVIFNKAVKQNDTVCLNLYKRVYPKMVAGEVVVR